jgi:hypothetical protein
MPRRTGPRPTAADTFLWRICKALDEPPRMLASNLGVPYSDLEPLLDHRHLLAEIDRDEVWWKIGEYVDQKLGDLMAVRTELNRALQRDRSRRVVNVALQRSRERKGSPRGR